MTDLLKCCNWRTLIVAQAYSEVDVRSPVDTFVRLEHLFVCCIFVILIIGGCVLLIQYIGRYAFRQSFCGNSPITLWRTLLPHSRPGGVHDCYQEPSWNVCWAQEGNRNGWEYRDNTTCTVVVVLGSDRYYWLGGWLVGWLIWWPWVSREIKNSYWYRSCTWQ